MPDDSPRQWTLRKRTGEGDRPFDSWQASIIGPDTEVVHVVEQSRLREVEAELNACEECGHKQAEPNWCQKCGKRPAMRPWAIDFLKRIENEKDELRNDAELAEARVERLEADLQEATDLLARFCRLADDARGHHGIEECSLPGQPQTEWDEIQEGLADIRERARGVLRKGETGAKSRPEL